MSDPISNMNKVIVCLFDKKKASSRSLTIEQIAEETSLSPEDVDMALGLAQHLGLVKSA